MLSLKATIPNQKISFLKLSLESICHAIQPYPYLACNFEINSLGVNVTYSLDMILFTLSIFRLYVIFKVLKFIIHIQIVEDKNKYFFWKFKSMDVFI